MTLHPDFDFTRRIEDRLLLHAVRLCDGRDASSDYVRAQADLLVAVTPGLGAGDHGPLTRYLSNPAVAAT